MIKLVRYTACNEKEYLDYMRDALPSTTAFKEWNRWGTKDTQLLKITIERVKPPKLKRELS